jgi:AcrR family transcriptional regulator
MKLDQSEERRSKAHAGGKAPGPSIRQSQKHATRSAIVRAARACFLASGVAKTSFDEVAERAVSSKDQLLLGMLGEDWDAQCALFALLPANAISPDAFAFWLREVIARYQADADRWAFTPLPSRKFPICPTVSSRSAIG